MAAACEVGGSRRDERSANAAWDADDPLLYLNETVTQN